MMSISIPHLSIIAQMELAFGQPSNLLIGLAVVIPILIHLWNQKQRHEEPWAASQFLNEALQEEKSRLNIHTLLLMAIRVSAILVLAIAMANPKLSRKFGSVPMTPTLSPKTYCVIDCSYSMGLNVGDSSLIEMAKSFAEQCCRAERNAGYSDVGLIHMGATSELFFDGSTDADRMHENLKQVAVDQSVADLQSALRLLTNLIDEMDKNTPINVLFFSDMQAYTWSHFRDLNCLGMLEQIAKRCEIVIIPIRPSGNVDNVAISKLELTTMFLTPNRTARIGYEIQNFKSTGAKIFASHVVDGRSIFREPMVLPPSHTEQKEFEYRFETGGEHTIEIRISDDGLNLDNRRYLSVHVPIQVHVTIVSDSAERSRYLTAAVEAASIANDVLISQKNEFSWSRGHHADTDLLLFAAVSQFTTNEASMLRDYMTKGGHAVVFLNEQSRLDNFNREFGAEGIDILPMRLDSIVDCETLFFDDHNFAHPLLEPFRGFQQSGLSQVPTWRYVRMELSDKVKHSVPLSFSNGDPAIVATNVGEGELIIVAFSVSSPTTSDDDSLAWTAWPLLPNFAPVIHQLIEQSLIHQQRRRNLIVGDPIQPKINELVSQGSVKVIQFHPTSKQPTVPTDLNDPRWSFSSTVRSGFFGASDATRRADVDSAAIPATQGGRTRSGESADLLTSQLDVIYAVNVDSSESNLKSIEMNSLPDYIKIVSDPERFLANESVSGEKHDRTYRFVLMVLLSLLVMESTLAWFFGRSA